MLTVSLWLSISKLFPFKNNDVLNVGHVLLHGYARCSCTYCIGDGFEGSIYWCLVIMKNVMDVNVVVFIMC